HHASDMLGSKPEEEFDAIVRLAAEMAEAPFACVCLVDGDRESFKSAIGFSPAEPVAKGSACNHVVATSTLTAVEDLLADERFRDGTLARSGLRFFAGAPLIAASGSAVGSLCIGDRKPRALDPRTASLLEMLASQAMTQLELRQR